MACSLSTGIAISSCKSNRAKVGTGTVSSYINHLDAKRCHQSMPHKVNTLRSYGSEEIQYNMWKMQKGVTISAYCGGAADSCQSRNQKGTSRQVPWPCIVASIQLASNHILNVTTNGTTPVLYFLASEPSFDAASCATCGEDARGFWTD